VGRFRYVMFSDALLEALSPAECEAVLAHEIAHSRYRHPVIYLLFTLGFVALAYDAMALVPPALRGDYLSQMPLLAILVVIYFRFLFGYLSRAFERQADVYAAGLVGSPVPLILALEKIALISGDIRELRSWRHHSVAERVRYLGEIGYDAEEQERYHASMRWLTAAVAASVVVFVGAAWYLWMREPEGISAKIDIIEDIVERRPTHYHAWTRLGELEAERGRPAVALRHFATAIRNNPGYERAQRGLLALDLPEPVRRRTLADAYVDAGFAQRAVAEAQRATDLAPSDAANWAALSRALLASGDAGRALAAAREGLRIDPSDEALKVLVEKASRTP